MPQSKEEIQIGFWKKISMPVSFLVTLVSSVFVIGGMYYSVNNLIGRIDLEKVERKEAINNLESGIGKRFDDLKWTITTVNQKNTDTIIQKMDATEKKVAKAEIKKKKVDSLETTLKTIKTIKTHPDTVYIIK